MVTMDLSWVSVPPLHSGGNGRRRTDGTATVLLPQHNRPPFSGLRKIDDALVAAPRPRAGTVAEGGHGYETSDRRPAGAQRTEPLREHIEATRAEMGETIDAIQERLSRDREVGLCGVA
jgi:hypothetical protein